MIEYADKDKDNRINFEEFREVVTKEYPPVWSMLNMITTITHFKHYNRKHSKMQR